MAQNMIGIRKEAMGKITALARRKKVSRQGLLSALVHMACGESDYGIIDLDWEKIQKDFPDLARIQKKSWAAVVQAVETLAEEEDSAEAIAMRSRFTIAQVKRALKELGYE